MKLKKNIINKIKTIFHRFKRHNQSKLKTVRVFKLRLVADHFFALVFFFFFCYCLMSLNLNLLGPGQAGETSHCIRYVYLYIFAVRFRFYFYFNYFFFIFFYFPFRCCRWFWHFMQPLGVNMLIRAMYNTLSPRRNRNVFEMLIKSDPYQIWIRSANILARLDSYLWQLVEIWPNSR